jgi:hypothetical protein
MKVVLVSHTIYSIVNYFRLFYPMIQPFMFSILHYVKKLQPPEAESVTPKPVPSMFKVMTLISKNIS